MERPSLETLLEKIRDGETYRELGAQYGVSHSTICNWLNAAPDQSARAEALLDSAEAWLDRGLDAVERAMDKDGRVDASAARAYAQECARRAAIRNPKYRDNSKVELDGTLTHKIQKLERVLIAKPEVGNP